MTEEKSQLPLENETEMDRLQDKLHYMEMRIDVQKGKIKSISKLFVEEQELTEKLENQIESMANVLREIIENSYEQDICNIAHNELNKWKLL